MKREGARERAAEADERDMKRKGARERAPAAGEHDMKLAIRLSLAVGFMMLALKVAGAAITGSSAILSDAAESVVHVLAVSFAAYSLSFGFKPADPGHLFGHDRISFFSAGFEGAMIILAAGYIVWEATARWVAGLAIERLGTGALLVALAALTNGALGWYLVRQGRRFGSLVLVANGKHVLTDCWTSLGVIAGLLLTLATGWLPFDPLLAILVAVNILVSGARLMRKSVGGLMDEADPETHRRLVAILERYACEESVGYHDLRHRDTGNRVFVQLHLLFPGGTPLAAAHEAATRIEKELTSALPERSRVITHLEPREEHDAAHAPLPDRPHAVPEKGDDRRAEGT